MSRNTASISSGQMVLLLAIFTMTAGRDGWQRQPMVPEECSDDMACKIAAIARVCGGIAGDIYEAVVNQAMIEAREQSHDGK